MDNIIHWKNIPFAIKDVLHGGMGDVYICHNYDYGYTAFKTIKQELFFPPSQVVLGTEFKEREQVAKFVSKEINSENPKTGKTAKAFLSKWKGNHSQGE